MLISGDLFEQESDLYRLRQFTISNKRIVQRSDSLQPRKSIGSVHSSASRYEGPCINDTCSKGEMLEGCVH